MSLSIGIPSYNHAEFIEETLESLLNQTVAPLEIVVSDDHSTDHTPDILREYRDRVRIIQPSKHLSMTANWNFVASHLSGPWFSLVCSDDIPLPNFVETLTRGTAVSDDAVLVRAAIQYVDGEGRILRDKYFRRIPKVVSPPDTLLEQLEGSKIAFNAFALRRDAWAKVGGFPERLSLEADRGMWMSIAPLGTFVYEDEIISRVRVCYREIEAEKRRSPLWAKDDLVLYTEIIPEVAARMSGVDEGAIQDAARKRCRKRLAMESVLLDGHEREEIADILNDWALKSGWESELIAFRQGKTLYRKPYGSVRRILSQTADFLRGVARDVRTARRYGSWPQRNDLRRML